MTAVGKIIKAQAVKRKCFVESDSNWVGGGEAKRRKGGARLYGV